MSFFSKLFKGDNAEGSTPAPPTPPPAPPPRTRSESPRKQAEAAQRERDEAAQKRAEAAVNEDAPTIEMAAQRPPAEEAPPAKPATVNVSPNATEELVLPQDVQAVAAPQPPPPPPPPALKAAAAAKTGSPMPAPPPPVGGARERETESSRGMPAARVKTGSAATAGSTVSKPIGAPKGLTAANKALAAANAARKGTPSPLPPPPVAAGAAAPAVRRSKADTIRGFAAPVLNAEGVYVPAPEHTLGQATAPEPAPAPDHAQSIASAVATTPVELPAAELDHAVEAAVDNLLDPRQAKKDAAAIEAERAADRRAAAETFHSIVAANAAPVRELMFQLSVGRTPRKWAGSCRSVLAPLLSGARQIELDDLSDAFAQLDSALELAAAETDAYIGPQTASAIQSAYTRLSGLLPQAFTALSERDGRRLMLLESLLLQVPAINRRVLGKLYGAGLSSLDRLSGANAAEISVVAGIDRKVAAALSAHLERFELERSQLDPVDARAQVHERLRGVLARLREQQEQFELAEQDEDLERKRESRRAREIATLELDVLLLEIGELSLTEELKRCAVRGKIERLESYLEHAQASA